MEFLRYKRAQGGYRLGVKVAGAAYDLADCYRAYRNAQGRRPPGVSAALAGASLRALLASPGARAFLDALRGNGVRDGVRPLDGAALVLGAPLHDPGRFIGIGLNYRSHAREMGQAISSEPPLFAKWANAIAGPYDDVTLPACSQAVDYEVELGVVIGRRAWQVAGRDALDYVFGYTVINDVSARDLQFRTGQWLAGKVSDGFAPMGPVVIEKEDVGPPRDWLLETWVNGDLRQQGRTSDMIHDVAALVSHLSHLVALEPGDVIATGTPPGVGMSRTPPCYLGVGDVVRMQIAGIGVIENRFVAPLSQ
ncbi:fumarylacetoacetate hydrolase family protein [Acidiferrobacter sp.]|jgi:acylpyruvate hydrolase|uniref:fumarylacetoacetate hydrolase family protein n=1 Tax=Acidiferrobacter sp. TaxID=1872107 RepID=UPI00260457BB|nr:fumarylacetoacetate hydrolase family protein [Acidiferrobacter sp.]